MSIKTRFLWSYIGVILFSISLLLITVFLIVFAITGDVNSLKQLYKKTYVEKPLTQAEESAFLDLKLIAKHNSEELLDYERISKIDNEEIEVVIRKNNLLTYFTKELPKDELLKALPEFEATNINARNTIQVEGDYYTYVKFDFYFYDNSKGSIFILKKANSYVEPVRELFPIIIGLLVIIFILVIGLLNYLVSRSIIKPIEILKEGAERIKSGDLTFKIQAATNNEIGQLTRSFEEMRVKLKDSIDLQNQYEENRKELLSNISHDLKTPITSIIGYVEGIKDGVANTPEKFNKYLSTIYKKSKELDLLIDQLFLFSKLDLHKETFVFEKVDIVKYMKDYTEELKTELIQQEVGLRTNLIESQVYVLMDRGKFKRLLSNLIVNCIKYMDKELKLITISMEESSETIRIQVSDNGAGIDSLALPFIFDRFYRAERSRNSKTGGSGLGLAIAKQIIEEHNGRIYAESDIGKGTSIFIILKKQER